MTTTAPSPLPAHQEWHRLTGDLDTCLRVASDIAGPTLLSADMSDADRTALRDVIGKAITVVYDLAFQHGRDSRGVIDDADKLWAIHHQGSDAIIAQHSRQAALDLVDALARHDAAEAAAHPDTAALHHAVVVEWPFSTDAHAEALADQEREGVTP